MGVCKERLRKMTRRLGNDEVWYLIDNIKQILDGCSGHAGDRLPEIVREFTRGQLHQF